MKKEEPAMRELFKVNGIFPAYFAGEPGFQVSGIEADYAYVLDSEGWKFFKRNGVSVALIAVDTVSGLPTLPAAIDFTAAKLPLDLVRRVTAWFRSVYVKYQSEAAGYLLYQPGTGAWDFVPPAQTAGPASVSYDKAPKREGWLVAGTIHSHASMSAFHSGTDHADEEFFDGVHITIGKLNSVPEYSCSVMVQGKRAMVDPSELIDGMAPAEAIPAAWLSAMKLPKPRGLAEPFAARADALYERYWRGDFAEPAYKAELTKINREAREAEEAERTTRVGSRDLSRADDFFSTGRAGKSASKLRLPAKKKGGHHGG
ncbi:MAG: Mov34/MPN/PAD-1 family protein [Candidatus Moranbacteria bacterium]|nr:Mov34/MPN/PAD-1 family protein [Candidatus Moranbacteria bacterium]